MFSQLYSKLTLILAFLFMKIKCYFFFLVILALKGSLLVLELVLSCMEHHAAHPYHSLSHMFYTFS